MNQNYNSMKMKISMRGVYSNEDNPVDEER